MSRAEVRRAHPDSDELPEYEQLSRRAVATGGRRVRLRRSVMGAMALLLCGTGAARWAEDPGDVVATGVIRAVSQTDSSPPAGPLSPGAGLAAASAPVATASSSTGVSAPTPARSATPHAEDDYGPGPNTPQTVPSRKAVPQAGTGVIAAVAIPNRPLRSSGRTVKYSVEVENGFPLDTAEVAQVVSSVLTDDRGWQAKDGVRFLPVSPAEAASGADIDIRITLASPSLTAELCSPLNVLEEQVSCWNGDRSVLNLTRWMFGSATYGSDLTAYRIYLVNHEVGHGLGHQHVGCPGAGQPAPVMVQQTKSLEGCAAWPFPTGS